MPTPAEVRRTVESIVGTEGDETVLEYVVSILEDGEFEFGTDGEEAFEAFGAVLVGCLCYLLPSFCTGFSCLSGLVRIAYFPCKSSITFGYACR